MTKINNLYENHVNKPNEFNSTDINEHLPTLKSYSEKYKHITEMGVRWGSSTIAFLAGNSSKLISYDIQITNEINEIINLSKTIETDFIFNKQDTLSIDIETTDVLFIDTLHTYNQLYSELIKHSEKVKYHILLHDTVSFREKDEVLYNHASVIIKNMKNSKKGLYQAVTDFITINNDWYIEKEYKNNNGLMVLSRNSNK
jgi:dGTP triphosphohydrolase